MFTTDCGESGKYISSDCEGKVKKGVKYQLHYDHEFDLLVNNCGNLLTQIFPEILPHLGCMHRSVTSTGNPSLRIAGSKKNRSRRLR
jgi:hypothetical protein